MSFEEGVPDSGNSFYLRNLSRNVNVGYAFRRAYVFFNSNYFFRAAHVYCQVNVRNISSYGSPYQFIRVCYGLEAKLTGIVDRGQLWEQI